MTHKDIREIFSMLANICFPTIINVITKDIIQFLNQIELVVDGKEFGYLINLLETNDFSSLEKNMMSLMLNLWSLLFRFIKYGWNIWKIMLVVILILTFIYTNPILKKLAMIFLPAF